VNTEHGNPVFITDSNPRIGRETEEEHAAPTNIIDERPSEGNASLKDSNVEIGREARPMHSEVGRPRRKYRKDPTLPIRAIELLGEFIAAEHVAKILDVSPSQVHRYKEAALRLGILVPYCGQNPRLYAPGPRYNLRKEPGWWSKKFEPVECRIHKGQGSSYVYAVERYTHFEELPFGMGDGTIEYRPLFKGRTHHPGYTLHKARLSIPSGELGYDGSAYLEARRRNDGSVTLYVSPPEVRRTLQEMEDDGDDPFLFVTSYIENTLERRGGWVFGDCKVAQSTHYAIALDRVNELHYELTEGVPRLKRGDSEEDLVLFIDKSIPSGELETTSPHIARDILAILEVERRGMNGNSSYGVSL
jgi:hypothetical protein